MKKAKSFYILLLSFVFSVGASAEKRLAFIGDSITAGDGYPVMIEIYLRACIGGRINVRSFAFPGDTALGFNKRMDEVISWKPTIATIQFGMNDGFYGRYTDWMGNNYKRGMNNAIDALKKIHCKPYLGTPTVMDPVYGKPNSIYAGKCNAETYNQTLEKLAGFTEEIAVSQKVPKVELFRLMSEIMEESKKIYGKNYVFTGLDGIHPGANGQLVMAYAFLKSMNMRRKIAEITVDMEGLVTVSEGHKVISWKNNELVLESTRYPFCHSLKTEEILPFISFQEDMNRFELKFIRLPKGKYRVSWGAFAKVFSSETLIKGINLADEFRNNPFRPAFEMLYKQIACRQKYEVFLVFELSPLLKRFSGKKQSAGELETMNRLQKKLIGHRDILEKEIFVYPVRHKIKIEKMN